MNLESSPSDATYCGHCGQVFDDDMPGIFLHQLCVARLAMEPPRYCTECRRRLTVQVTPTGWTAKCSRHGITEA